MNRITYNDLMAAEARLLVERTIEEAVVYANLLQEFADQEPAASEEAE